MPNKKDIVTGQDCS